MTDKENRTLRLDVQAAFEDMTRKVWDRLVVGQQVYGDASLLTPLGATIEEIEQEMLDVIGWIVILRLKLRRIETAVEKVGAVTTA